MEKKIILWMVACAVAACVAGCGKSDNYQLMKDSKEKILPIYEEKEIGADESALASLRDVNKSGYMCEEWQGIDIDSPGGVLCGENEIIISDRKNDCIIKTDYEGNLIKKIGETGSGEGEFLSPGAIAGYKDNLYIIDQGNQRIQILDGELNYIGELKLKNVKTSDPDYQPGTLAVSEEGVYVAGLSLKNPVIDKYKNEKREEIGDNLIGAVSIYEDNVYAINSMVRYYDKENDSFGAATNGPGWLFAVTENKLKTLCELPYGVGITGFAVDETGIVCCSGAAGAVFILNHKGKYEETAAYIQGLEDEEFPQISIKEQGEYYIALPKTGRIFRCHKAQEQ